MTLNNKQPKPKVDFLHEAFLKGLTGRKKAGPLFSNRDFHRFLFAVGNRKPSGMDRSADLQLSFSRLGAFPRKNGRRIIAGTYRCNRI